MHYAIGFVVSDKKNFDISIELVKVLDKTDNGGNMYTLLEFVMLKCLRCRSTIFLGITNSPYTGAGQILFWKHTL